MVLAIDNCIFVDSNFFIFTLPAFDKLLASSSFLFACECISLAYELDGWILHSKHCFDLVGFLCLLYVLMLVSFIFVHYLCWCFRCPYSCLWAKVALAFAILNLPVGFLVNANSLIRGLNLPLGWVTGSNTDLWSWHFAQPIFMVSSKKAVMWGEKKEALDIFPFIFPKTYLLLSLMLGRNCAFPQNEGRHI